MRRVWSMTSRHVNSFTFPPPTGCVSATRSGAVRSQWYSRCSASASAATGIVIVVSPVVLAVTGFLLRCAGRSVKPGVAELSRDCRD